MGPWNINSAVCGCRLPLTKMYTKSKTILEEYVAGLKIGHGGQSRTSKGGYLCSERISSRGKLFVYV
eukprot:scaffold37826_cov219-Skeletonema_marinoi.AAC.10